MPDLFVPDYTTPSGTHLASDAEVLAHPAVRAIIRERDEALRSLSDLIQRHDAAQAELAAGRLGILRAEALERLQAELAESRDRADIAGRMHRHHIQRASGQRRDIDNG